MYVPILFCRPLDVLSVGYIKILKAFLTISASWPYQIAGGKVHSLYKYYGRCIIPFGVTAISFEVWFLIDNFNVLSLFEVGHMYLSLFLATLSIARTFLPLFSRYGEIVERFLLSFHLTHFKHKGSYHLKMYEKLEWLSHRVVIITLAFGMLCAVAYNMMPIINNISSGAYKNDNKTVELSVYFSYPGFDPQDHYKFATIFNFYVVFGCAILVSGIDLLMTLFVIQIIGHIEVLKNSLLTFPEPKKSTDIIKPHFGRIKQFAVLTAPMFTEEENLVIKEKLKDCVKHHLFIVSFTDDMSDFFGPVLAIYFLFHQVSGCILLLELSAGDPDALTKYGPLTVTIFGQLIIISTIYEIVNTKSELLATTAYSMPWECMNVSNRRSVCILLRRLQRPIAVRALGVTAVNVQTMSTILKTSFSYFTFLRTLND
ncbi:odorant receptor 67a-like isoform X1 [Cydia strobilella]|uniref:odorant receptor 67a-like isoform X1 n=1 Tax=Cydia strobilella TaxID=1100964 RepID=UPI003007B7CA